jgi:hypothetical protein
MDKHEREYDGFRPGQLDTARDEAATLRQAAEDIGATLAKRFGFMERKEITALSEILVNTIWNTSALEQLTDAEVCEAVCVEPHGLARDAMYGAWEAAFAEQHKGAA